MRIYLISYFFHVNKLYPQIQQPSSKKTSEVSSEINAGYRDTSKFNPGDRLNSTSETENPLRLFHIEYMVVVGGFLIV